MAREIHTRWKINGTLKAETPIHIGGVGGDADTDLALAINGQGNYYLPGTSLAGALRSWMGRSLEETHLNDLWGFQDTDQGHASFIMIDDAEIEQLDQTIEIRESVGINRHTGTAADQAKYSRAILPKGVSFPLNITLDCKKDQQPDNLWQLLLALEKGDIRIGAAKTRGLGKVKLTVSSIHEQTFKGEHIFDVLLNGGTTHQWKDLKPKTYHSPAKLSLDIKWTPKDPVMVKSEGEGIAVDILPLVSQANQKTFFVIPGSSIKGVLRTQAERIVRTVCNKSTPEEFSEQVKLDLVNELFGKAENNSNGKPQGKMSALSVDDCYATIEMETEKWSAVEQVAKSDNQEFQDFKETLKTAVLGKESNENPFRKLQPAMHVAVDRWTGGAADGMLYSVLEPIGVEWDNIAIHLDLERLKNYDSKKVQPALALLLLVLRDFADRKIPIGYGTNRGMGTVEVQEMKLDCTPIEGLPEIENKTAITPDLSNLGEEILNPLNTAWQNWIACKLSGGGMSQTESKTLYSYHSDQNLTLKDAIAQCSKVLKGAIALLYSPQSCQFLRLTHQKFQYPNGEEKQAHELSDIFEARIFNEQCELRWLNRDNGNGKAVLLSELEQSILGFIPLNPISCESLKQKYLLWGKGIRKDDNCSKKWQRLAEARIGELDIPLNTTLEESQPVYLETREYIAEWVNNEDSNSENYGNYAVIEERLVELKPKPLEVKK